MEPDRTNRRLLESAGEVFSERGFREATVRNICQRAGTNVSSIKYHFGDKAGLYIATLEYALACGTESYPYDAADDASISAPEQLRIFIRLFLLRLLAPGRPAWHGRLLLREMIEPTTGFDVLAQGLHTNIVERLTRIVRAYLGPEAHPLIVRDAVYSITAQCTFYRQAQRYIESFEGRAIANEAEIDRLAERIYEFSIAVLSACEQMSPPSEAVRILE